MAKEEKAVAEVTEMNQETFDAYMEKMAELKEEMKKIKEVTKGATELQKAQKRAALKTGHNFGGLYLIGATTEAPISTEDVIKKITEQNSHLEADSVKRSVGMSLKYLNYVIDIQTENGVVITRNEEGEYIAVKQ